MGPVDALLLYKGKKTEVNERGIGAMKSHVSVPQETREGDDA